MNITEPLEFIDSFYTSAFESIWTSLTPNKNGEGGIPSDTPKHPMTRDVTAFVKRGEIPTTFPTTL